MANNAATQVNRSPRVLFFIAGMMPSDEEKAAIDKFRPNAAFRNATAVGNMPMSALEECDAVAGPAIPARYAETYPNVNDFDGSHMIRMSDVDLFSGPVTSTSNERKRAAKPPALGQSVEMSQGAPRPRGATIEEQGGLVIPRSTDPNALPMFGSERAENAQQGVTPGSTDGTGLNPHSLPAAGAQLLPAGAKSEDFSSAGARVPAPTGTGGFSAPEPVTEKDEEEGETANKQTAAKSTNKTSGK